MSSPEAPPNPVAQRVKIKIARAEFGFQAAFPFERIAVSGLKSFVKIFYVVVLPPEILLLPDPATFASWKSLKLVIRNRIP
jgi:hypothetical protein